MVTIKDISRRCGVSPATVSKALNGYGDISAETMELVRRTAREMHYLPNAAARQLKTNSSHNIGVVFVDETMSGLTHEYFSTILNSVKEEAEGKGYDITFLSQSLGERKMSFLEHCRYRKCDGVVIASVNFESDSVLELIRSEVPVITIDYSYDNTSSVVSDNVEGAYGLTSYLIEMGHRKIAFIHGEPTSVTQKRLQGFHRALEEHGIDVPAEYVREGRYHDPESGRRDTGVLLNLSDPPTAIMFPDDYTYLGGLAEFEKRHLSVPEDISVVGYDGIHLSRVLRPQLTTWYQDAEAIGRDSVLKLIECIEHRKTCVQEQIKVAGRLMPGYSVKNIL
ncbi:MAG: LacI family DNA-binding transcriptional regulator [Eubacterium sp.]|nr:LacI family DNA-binding transcriptional regulator [Eubacterium sp.]